MSIEQKPFTNEDELQTWVEANIRTFFGDVLYLPGNFHIFTKRNKGGKPDGFVLDVANSRWTIIETELLRHGVWDHIAEQVMRFVVAAQCDATKRKIRDKFFEAIESRELIDKYSDALGIPKHRLVQRVENIIEGQTPEIAIFIDDVNEDLEDFVEALNATAKVFKIQKYLVNGVVEYLSPEGSSSLIETTVEEVSNAKTNIADTLELLGGGRLTKRVGNIKLYELDNGDIVSIKYSKFYPEDRYYWYGITPQTIQKYEQDDLSHLVFILGNEGVVKLPLAVLKEYLDQTKKSLNADETVRHYHVTIKNEPSHMMWINRDSPTWDVEDHFFVFET